MSYKITRYPDGGYIDDTKLSSEAMRINDDVNTTAKKKESLLKKLFKDVYELEFFGEYTK